MKKTLALFVVVLGVSALFGWRTTAQSGVTVTFDNAPSGNVFNAGGDYATDVLGDPWDMANMEDISIDPAQRQFWSCSTGTSCVDLINDSANGASTAIGGTWNGAEGLTLLYQGHYDVINNVRNGRRFPIDTTVYKKISFKIRENFNAIPNVQWFHKPYSDPTDTTGGPGNAWNFAGFTTTSYNIAAVDLATGSPNTSGQAWTNGNVVGLRIDPTLGGASNKAAFFDWVRLTAADDATGSAMQTVRWTGSGTATVKVTDSGGTSYTVSCAATTNTTCRWNYGILPPGTYTVTVTNSAGSGTASFRVNAPPTVRVTTPSVTSGEDYASANLGNAWDMHDAADIDNDVVCASNGCSDHLLSKSFPGTEFVGVGDGVATSTTSFGIGVGDPQVYMLANNGIGASRGSIDSTKYRYLTFTMQLDRAYDLLRGSVGRVMWGQTAAFTNGMSPMYNLTVTTDMIVWPGSVTYTLDMASLGLGPDQGILPAPFSPNPTLWNAAAVRQLRIDPDEFAEQVPFHMSNVTLTAMSEVAPGGTFTVRFNASDADGDALSVHLFRDGDNNAANGGMTEITTSALSGSATSFNWDTTGVPTGTYYIYAQVSDGKNTTGAYSSAPVTVKVPSAGPPDPHIGLDAPANGATVGTTFAVSGWTIDRAATSGTGVDGVQVYAIASSGAATFLGAATYGSARADIGFIFGSQFTNAGFSLSASGLAAGTYTIAAYPHSTVSNAYAAPATAVVTVSLPVSRPVVLLDGPQNDSTVGRTVTVAGWAIDQGTTSGTGVDAIHVYAFPTDGSAGQFLGVATYGLARPDIGAAVGSQFTSSGFRLSATVTPPGKYRFVAFAHSTVANSFNGAAAAENVTVQSSATNAVLYVDTPSYGSTKARPFTMSGWAVDSGATTGTGIDFVDMWAFALNGAGTYLGAATYGLSRPDIGSLFGDSRFAPSGFTFTVSGSNLAAGTYDIVPFGRSTVTNAFTVARVMRVTVQ